MRVQQRFLQALKMGNMLSRMEVEGKNCNPEKRAGFVPGHQLNQRYAFASGTAWLWLIHT